MKYIKVRWLHDFSDYPEYFYQEIAYNHYEQRRVEVFHNGEMLFTDGKQFSSNMKYHNLSPVPIINLDEINSQQEFKASEINKIDFEKIWKTATLFD